MSPSPAERSLNDISAQLHALAERLSRDVAPLRPLRLDAEARWVLTQAVHDLRRHVPGLRAFGNPEGAYAALAACQESLVNGQPAAALVCALRGLACAPNHPELHYAAAAAALENGAVAEAVLLLRHTLWLKPGHAGAQSDLAAMFDSGVLDAGQGAPPDDAWCDPGLVDPPGGGTPGLDPLDLDDAGLPRPDPDREAA